MKGFRTSCSFSSPELSLSQGSSTARRRSPDRSRCSLSLPLHPSGRHLEPPPHRSSTTRASPSAGKTIDRRAGPLKTMRSPAGVHPALSPARAAQGLPPHPPLRALRQRQARREHRKSPRAARRRPARRRPATAAGDHSGRAACGALPMPALRRPHDRHRGLRPRLPAEMAADAGQVRHLMSQTPPRRAASPFWCAGSTPAAIPLDPIQGNQRARRPLIPFKPVGTLLPLSARRRVQASRSRRPQYLASTGCATNLKSP